MKQNLWWHLTALGDSAVLLPCALLIGVWLLAWWPVNHGDFGHWKRQTSKRPHGPLCHTYVMNTLEMSASMDQLAQLLNRQPDILLATVFGSFASGHARADSDVDISVLADKPLDAGRKQELIKLLAKASGCPVDLVDLRTAGVLLRRSALLNGKRLVCRDNQIYADLLSRTLTDVEDFLPYRERLLKQRTNAWTS